MRSNNDVTTAAGVNFLWWHTFLLFSIFFYYLFLWVENKNMKTRKNRPYKNKNKQHSIKVEAKGAACNIACAALEGCLPRKGRRNIEYKN